MRPLDFALEVIARGASPVPVAFMGKAPTDAKTGTKIKNWQALRISAESASEHFNGEPQNIGVLLGEPSGGLVDVDLDCPEALDVAAEFLSATRTLGRASAPSSHWFYLASDAQNTIQLRDPNLRDKDEKKTIVELRANGSQTVIFGTHTSGETIAWADASVEIAASTWADIKTAVHRIGASVLIGRYLPHAPWQAPALHALARAQLDAGWSTDDVFTFAKATLRVADAPIDFDLDDARESRGLEELATLMSTSEQKRALGAALAWLGIVQPATHATAPAIDPEDEPEELAAVADVTRAKFFTDYIRGIDVDASNDGSGQLVKLAALGVRGFALGERGACETLWAWSQQKGAVWTQQKIYKRCEDAMRGPRGGAPLPWGFKILERLEREKAKAALPAPLEEALVRDTHGRVEDLLANVTKILREHDAWKGAIRYDAFRQEIVLVKPTPFARPSSAPAIWSDTDDARMQEWLQLTFGFEPSKAVIGDAVALVAEEHAFHGARDYFVSLPAWDEGDERLPTMLANYLGARPGPYTAGIGTAWMISAVARVMRPGCQADYMLGLEGPQGIGKSSFLRMLCPRPEWYSDTGITIGQKDSYLALHGKLIYCFDELASIKGSEVTKTKNFLTSTSDNLRPPWGRRNRDYPRQTVFAYTTNEGHYLRDRTGNRRAWPVACTRADVAGIERDRDLLWAEAYARFKRGERWWPDAELDKLCAEQQADRVVGDPWADIIQAWLNDPTEPSVDAHGRPTRDRLDRDVWADGMTTALVLTAALGKRPGDITRADEMRVADVLREIGWENSTRKVEQGRRVRVWMAPPTDLATDREKGGRDE